MNICERQVKSILSPSKVYDYVINPYVGCQFGCSYCYARYMRRFSHHAEPWGEFVDIKINAEELLKIEIRKKIGKVWISGVCDPYQPLEKKYGLTRKCLQILSENDWPVIIQTRSPLVVNDIDVIREMKHCEAGLTITTADDQIRKLFEPKAPPIADRIKALSELHESGIKTYAMIAPILPGAEKLPDSLKGIVDYIIVDRMNYGYADHIYRDNNMLYNLSDDYFHWAANELKKNAEKFGIEYHSAKL